MRTIVCGFSQADPAELNSMSWQARFNYRGGGGGSALNGRDEPLASKSPRLLLAGPELNVGLARAHCAI